MAHTRKTLLLNSQWDLTLDKSGRIAVAEGPYATAQAVANVRTKAWLEGGLCKRMEDERVE